MQVLVRVSMVLVREYGQWLKVIFDLSILAFAIIRNEGMFRLITNVRMISVASAPDHPIVYVNVQINVIN